MEIPTSGNFTVNLYTNIDSTERRLFIRHGRAESFNVLDAIYDINVSDG
ncbi:MAG: hypothetical protein LBM19_02735 [Holosporales bacterium]|nr:hypothetical protein [Holosporales bacterium]